MKKRILASALACMTIMSGCGNTNLPRMYKKQLDFTFDKNYTVEYNKEYEDQSYKQWDISYTTKNGYEINSHIWNDKYTKDQKEYYKSKKELDNSNYWDFYISEMMNIGEREAYDKLVSKYFGINYDQDLCDDETFSISMAVPFFCVLGYDESMKDLVENEYYNSKKLSEMTLSSIACDKYMVFKFIINLRDGVDPEPYIEKMKAMEEEFKEITGSPQNYSFLLKKSKDGNGTTFYRKDVLFGEELDYEEEIRKAEANGEKYTLNKAVARVMFPDESEGK